MPLSARLAGSGWRRSERTQLMLGMLGLRIFEACNTFVTTMLDAGVDTWLRAHDTQRTHMPHIARS